MRGAHLPQAGRWRAKSSLQQLASRFRKWNGQAAEQVLAAHCQASCRATDSQQLLEREQQQQDSSTTACSAHHRARLLAALSR
jgi:hypothetical protein